VRLVAVVLNWNGGEDTLAALASLADVETICVDNGSTDGSDGAVEERFPEVELVRTGANLGFAGGNNAGIRRALERGADWVLLLNNDAAAEPGLVDALERAAATRPDAGLLACKVLFADGETVQYAGARYRAWLGYSGRERGHGSPDTFHEPVDVDRADGAALAVSRAAVERAGLLDERLFAYVEDVEWSLRIRRAGFAAVFVPDARVRHRGSTSTGGAASTANLYYDTRNTIVVCERHRPLPRGLRALRRGVVVGAHLVQAAAHPSRGAAALAVLAGWRDARRGRLGQRSSRETSSWPRAVASHEERAAWARPRAVHSAGASSTSRTAAAIACGSCGSKRRAASPTTSGSAAAFEQATGQPQATATSGGWPKPS
jgi:GT2 family glycosyltransferase